MNERFAQVSLHFSTLTKFGSNLGMAVMRANNR
jgi:hypothetical protein